MVFTQIEKEIAKQMLKIGFIIIILVVFISFAFNFIYSLKGGTEQINTVEKTKKEVVEKPVVNIKQELPLVLEIPDYGIRTMIESPQVTDVRTLDNALNKSAVYYPGSGLPGSNNTLIFGHSTGFKVVMNKAYQVFNNIKSVKPGTLIYVRTQSEIHIYRTREVKRVSKYTSWIQFKSDTPMLTLATCDSFGKASDRWVLEADYVGVK